ncbi:MAG: Gfo/Idh/MocA family oxidoreductase [Candidatus Hydrogenedentes bacterium]|nr:Gfo/Idh/MocA family oxidoreductase [Candidatus Hydrogenedentota bacterium]
MSGKFRAAMIGCGAIAQRLHVPDYAVCPEAEIVALCDLVPSKAKLLAERYAPGAAVYTDYKKMLRNERIDGVTVALPNYLHAPVTIDALRAGCHVMVEKPMAASPAEAQRMIDAAKKARKVLMVNQSQRRFAPHRKAREIVESGILGKILHVTGMFGHEGPENWSPEGKWFFRRKQARFGAMADLGVHKADIIRYITGKEVAEISAYTACLEKKGADVEDNFVSCLTFTDGTVGTLCASWTVKGMSASYTILHCSNGTLQVAIQEERALLARLINPECEIEFELPAPLNDYPGTWGLDVSGGFVRAAMGLEEPFCTGEEGKRSLDIIFAAEKSALTGRSVRLGQGAAKKARK